jgi:hypothetical protein
VRDTNRLSCSYQEYQKERGEYVCFKANKIAAQSNRAKYEQEDLREVDIDENRHEGKNQHRAEGKYPDRL